MLLAAILLLAAQPTAEATDGCPGAFAFFEPGSARLDSAALYNIEGLLLWVRPMVEAGAWLNLYGGADDARSADANMALARRRAEAVRDYLLRRGFRGEQLRLPPRGNTEPLVVTSGGRSDAQNRHARIHPEMPISVFRRFFPPGAPIC
jgi:outer membrane protein OmpA-like peptidoglycan-associated protein